MLRHVVFAKGPRRWSTNLGFADGPHPLAIRHMIAVRQRSRRTIDIALVTGCRKTDGHPGVGAPH